MKTPPQGPPAKGPERLRWLNEQLVTLAKACPHTKSNPSDCPLCEVRKLEPAAISEWLDGLRTEDKEYLMLYHQCCLVIRWETEHGGDSAKPSALPWEPAPDAPAREPKPSRRRAR